MGSFNAQVVPESRVALSHYLIMDKYGHLVRVDNPLVSQGKKFFVTGTIEFLDKMQMGVKLGPKLVDHAAGSNTLFRPQGPENVNQVEFWLAVKRKEDAALSERFVHRHAKAI